MSDLRNHTESNYELNRIIYCLTRDGVPFYVGCSFSMKTRFKAHQKRFGNDICFFELDSIVGQTHSGKYYLWWENYYIDLFRSFGFNLENKFFSKEWRTRKTKRITNQ